MISVGLMSVVSIAVTSLTVSMARQSFQQSAKNSFQTLVNNLYSMTNNQSVCTNTFKGKYYNPSVLPQAVFGGILVSGFQILPGKKFGNMTIDSLNWVTPDAFIGNSSAMVGSVPVTLTSHLLSMEISAFVRLSNSVNQKLDATIQFIVGVDSSNIIQNCLSTIDPNDVCTQLGGVNLSGRCGLTLPIQAASQGQSCSPEGLIVSSAAGDVWVCSGAVYKLFNPALTPTPSPTPTPTKNCSSIGAASVTDSSNGVQFCRVGAYSCPAGTSPYQNWTNTQPQKCCDARIHTSCCTTSSHSWGNVSKSTDSCNYQVYIRGVWSTYSCPSTTIEIGCTL